MSPWVMVEGSIAPSPADTFVQPFSVLAELTESFPVLFPHIMSANSLTTGSLPVAEEKHTRRARRLVSLSLASLSISISAVDEDSFLVISSSSPSEASCPSLPTEMTGTRSALLDTLISFLSDSNQLLVLDVHLSDNLNSGVASRIVCSSARYGSLSKLSVSSTITARTIPNLSFSRRNTSSASRPGVATNTCGRSSRNLSI
mmetsp:Transcript_11234/g.11256  ORF Transcript_11234/g.11256 Transcript_11234/m.11256 type:complete len:202 (-) Transcript_11234:764-1369(-)